MVQFRDLLTAVAQRTFFNTLCSPYAVLVKHADASLPFSQPPLFHSPYAEVKSFSSCDSSRINFLLNSKFLHLTQPNKRPPFEDLVDD
jgi:hypothetical protein